MHLLGITWIGATDENLRRAGVTLAFVLAVLAARYLLAAIVQPLLAREALVRMRFWVRQGLSLAMTAVLLFGVLSIWFDDTTRLATFLGLFSAGVAFALQKVITAWAGYFVILRGNSFTQGDRISLGEVRGDVMALNFTQTQIMEMGEPPADDEGPHTWVQSRQFTGRIVTVSNARIFDEPVYNYTREFPFIWDEMHLPVRYQDDAERAEAILLAVARRHVRGGADVEPHTLHMLQDRYGVQPIDLEPRVFWRITANWLDLTLRFVFEPHGVRAVKDCMSREILPLLRAAGIEVASATYDVVGFPPVEFQTGGGSSREVKPRAKSNPPDPSSSGVPEADHPSSRQGV